MSLTRQQIKDYREQGFLLLENVIDDITLARLRQTIARCLEASRQVTASNDTYDLDPSHSAEQPAVRRLKDPHARDPLFFEISRMDAIIDPVAQLLGGTVRFDHSKLNFKPARGDARILWHQDWAFYPYTNDDMLAVGVMIEDCTPQNGPLKVIPGSHRGPVFNHHVDGVFAGGIADADLGALLDDAVELTGKAGSITLHHVRTLHASSNNTTDRDRPLLLFSYVAVDAFPIMQPYDMAEFNSRIIRGEPVIAGRMEALPFRIHLPQHPDADSIYEDQAQLKAREVT